MTRRIRMCTARSPARALQASACRSLFRHWATRRRSSCATGSAGERPMISGRLLVAGCLRACVLLIAFRAFAQDEVPALRALPVGDVLLSLPSNRIAPHGQWEWKFTHRFNQSLSQGTFADQLHSMFGLDTNADVVFGASYAMRPDLQL